ncbi:MAG: 50S ribosomal protein L32 [Candidatus Dormibacteria bacterium]|nr:50S ribosomal protein L32 [Candidatus Dormibacteraeota bacterium]
MALPKERVPKARRDRRRSHLALAAPTLAPCPRCRHPRRPHTVCPNCGQYRGREVIATE